MYIIEFLYLSSGPLTHLVKIILLARSTFSDDIVYLGTPNEHTQRILTIQTRRTVRAEERYRSKCYSEKFGGEIQQSLLMGKGRGAYKESRA